jgi:hypothetical protein
MRDPSPHQRRIDHRDRIGVGSGECCAFEIESRQAFDTVWMCSVVRVQPRAPSRSADRCDLTQSPALRSQLEIRVRTVDHRLTFNSRQMLWDDGLFQSVDPAAWRHARDMEGFSPTPATAVLSAASPQGTIRHAKNQASTSRTCSNVNDQNTLTDYPRLVLNLPSRL